MKHIGDICKINGAEIEPVDCIIGGSPCQDLSAAGKRAGLAGKRSGLFMEQIRIIKEMRENDRTAGRAGQFIRPRYMVWENVPGAFSANKRADFAAVLEETVRIVEPEAPSVPVPKKGWPTAGCLMGDGWSVAWRVLDAQFWGVPQRRRRIALVADFGGESAPEILFNPGGVQGNPSPCRETRERTSRSAERGAGKAGSIHITQDPISVVEKTPCLSAGSTNGQAAIGVYCLQGNGIDRADTAGCNGKGRREDDCGGVVPSLQARMGTGGNQVPLTFAPKRFAEYARAEKAAPLRASGADCGGGSECFVVRRNMTLRRLTPLECERLQGFPDGWTDIGAWTDSKGKHHKESFDSTRYKAMGNSIALPPWKWVLKRLCANYERDATLGSLFDGVGGFPLIWSQLNGVGSVKWASEIEGFPIAVTKRHCEEGLI